MLLILEAGKPYAGKAEEATPGKAAGVAAVDAEVEAKAEPVAEAEAARATSPDAATAKTRSAVPPDPEALALARRLGFETVGAPARLMVRGGVAPPWVTRVRLAREQGAPRPFAAIGYEFG